MHHRRWARRVRHAALVCLALGLLGPVAPPASVPDATPPERAAARMARAGAALREALAARDRGEFDAAEARFEAVALAYPLVAADARLLALETALAAGRPEVASASGAALLSGPVPPELRLRILRGVGQARLALGDEAGGRDALLAALDEPASSDDRAQLLAELARSLARSGEPAAAQARWLELWTDHGETASAAEAAAALDAAVAAGAPDPRDAAAYRRRAERLAALYRNPEALAACDRALALGSANDVALRRLRAQLLFRLRRYPEAEVAYAALGKDADARFWRARALARAGRIDESIRAFRELAANPRRALDARALYLAGTLIEDDDTARAREVYARVARDAPDAGLRRESLWRIGWTSFLETDYVSAARAFDRLAREQPDPLDQLQARYWRARARAAGGDPGAAAELEAIAREYPFSYFGWRAAGSRPLAHATPAAEPTRAGGFDPEDPGLERARILIEAGLPDDAIAALSRLAGGARGDALLGIARLLQAADAYALSQRLVLDQNALRLARAPAAGDEELWWLAYPDAYAAEVEDAAARHGVPSALLYAVMREESGYRPLVVSPVGARGLTQIMPATGARLAARVGLDGFHPDQLFEPAVNLELGALYLAELLERFGGRWSAAAASYNAGPDAVTRWLAERGTAPDDFFVEAIPYDETRGYVKRVLRSAVVYQSLYAR